MQAPVHVRRHWKDAANMRGPLAVFLALTASAAFAAAPWHHPLYLGNGGLWRQRVAIEARNDGDRAVAGESVALAVGEGAGQARLAGARAEAVRVCDARGIEMLFGVSGPDGRPVEQGPIPTSSTLTIPVECPAKASAAYYVYFDNPDAWRVPDFWRAVGKLRNGGVEAGEGDTPEGWNHDGPDSQHRATWVSENPHSGRKCLKTVVAAGAPAAWIATRQTALQIVGGARYVMTAWVKAENVVGDAGWYIHVGNDRNPMITSPMLSGGGGTYDWKQVRAEFTAPAEARTSDLGTVLWGTGTAWFDDVELTCLDEVQVTLTATAAAPETLTVRDVGAGAPWFRPAGVAAAYDYRVPVRVTNLADRPSRTGLITVNLAGILARLGPRVDPGSARVVDGGKSVKAYRLQDTLLFEGSVPPQTRKTYYVCFAAARAGRPVTVRPQTSGPMAPNPAIPEAYQDRAAIGAGADYQALLTSSHNLVKNPSFERGDRLPEAWPGTAEGQMPAGSTLGLDEPGLLGRRCVRMVIPKEAKTAWTGWRQDVPVEPGRTYLYAAWLKCRDLVGGLQLHAHRCQADGSLCKQDPMTGVGPALEGTQGWTLLSGVFDMPEDCRTFQLHLTMLATGTAWHDGVVLTEVMAGEAGALEGRAAQSSAGLAVWPVNAIVKVFRDDPAPRTPTAAAISCARNEFEPLQLAVRSARAVSGVTVEVVPPKHPRGDVLREVQVGVVGYVPIDHATSYYSSDSPAWQRKFPTAEGASDGWPGWWPDPLLPRATFDLAANQTQPFWVTVKAPQGARPGDYQGQVRLIQGGKVLQAVPFTVHVWGFALPDQSHVKAIFDCRQGGAIWQVPGQSPQETRQAFWEFMADHRVCPDGIQPAPDLRYENGRVVADFAEFDKAGEYYFNVLKLPHTYTPWYFYCFGWGHPTDTKFGEQPYAGTYPFEGVDRSQLRPEFKRAYQACLRVYLDHMKQQGWYDRVTLYISDEPYDSLPHILAQMQALCDMIHEVDPSIPIYSSTWHHQPAWDGYLTAWGLGHYGIVPVAKLRELERSGVHVWWTTDGQMCTDTPYCAVERLLPHYCFKYGAEAYEFWGIDWLTYDPYQFGWHAYISQAGEPGKYTWVRYPSGDGFLAYPGKPIGHPGPVSSIRLEQAREGVEDYEYLYLLREAIATAKAEGRNAVAGEQALAAAQTLVTIPNAGGRYSTKVLPDPDRVLVVKKQVAQAIEQLNRGR
jgi:hypothetical protein